MLKWIESGDNKFCMDCFDNKHAKVSLPVCLSACLPTSLPLSVCLSVCLPLPLCLSVCHVRTKYVCTHVCMTECMYVCMYVRMYTVRTYVRIYIYIYMAIYTVYYVFMYLCMRLSVCLCRRDYKVSRDMYQNLYWSIAHLCLLPVCFQNCARCKTIIRTSSVNHDGNTYHSECFTCFHCRKPLAGITFSKQEGHNVCQDCFHNRYAKTCHKCKKLIEGTAKFASYEEKFYHACCFTCAKCDCELMGKKFFVNGNDKTCIDCGH